VSHNGFRAGSIPAVGAGRQPIGLAHNKKRMEMARTIESNNDFDSDLYVLNKLVNNIFDALSLVSLQERFAFVGAELSDKPALVEQPEINWDMPFVWDEVSEND